MHNGQTKTALKICINMGANVTELPFNTLQIAEQAARVEPGRVKHTAEQKKWSHAVAGACAKK